MQAQLLLELALFAALAGLVWLWSSRRIAKDPELSLARRFLPKAAHVSKSSKNQPSEFWLRAKDAIELVRQGADAGLAVLGIDGSQLEGPSGIRPRNDRTWDFADALKTMDWPDYLKMSLDESVAALEPYRGDSNAVFSLILCSERDSKEAHASVLNPG